MIYECLRITVFITHKQIVYARDNILESKTILANTTE